MTVAGQITTLALDAAFATFGTPALYTQPGIGQTAVPCLVITPGQDRTAPFDGARPFGRGDIVKVRASEVANPVRNGTFGPDVSQAVTIAGTYTINDDPQQLDPERLEWTCRASFRAS